jgi:hypothetical protein
MNEILQTRFDEQTRSEPRSRAASEVELWVRVERIQRRVQRLIWLDATATLISALVLIVVIGIALDWWFRPTTFFGRTFVLASVATGLVSAIVGFVWKQRANQISRLSVARRLEAVCPGLGDRLSSAVALLEAEGKTSKPSTPSSELAMFAVEDATRELETAEPESRIDWRPAAWSSMIATLLVSAVVMFCFWRPANASLAVQRIFTPSADAEWPRRNQLILENVPQQIYAGATLEVFVRDQLGNLPNDVEILFRPISASPISPPLRMQGNTAAASYVAGATDIDIRAIGGDDRSMPWQRVRVATAPAIESYRLTLRPPAYLGLEDFDVAEPQFTVLHGTTLQLSTVLSLPVTQAELVLRNEGSKTDEERFACEISEDGTQLLVSGVELKQSCEFWITWVDNVGLAGESDRRWRVAIQEDSIPRVVLESPESDLDVTAAANISLVGQGSDDIGLMQGWLEIQHVQSATLGRIGFEEAEENANQLALQWNGPLYELLRQINDNTLQTIDTSTFKGSTVEITAVALDTAGQRGQSTTRRLRIVSDEEMRQSIAREQSEAMRELVDARMQQQIAMEQTEGAVARLDSATDQNQAANDRVRAAMTAQRSASQSMFEGADSAAKRLERAGQLARDNGFDDGELERLSQAVNAIAQGSMSQAKEALAESSDAMREGESEKAGRLLKQAAESQKNSLQALDQMVDSMRRDDSERSANDELGELSAAQARLSSEARNAATATNPDAERQRLSGRQRELARDAQKLAEKLQQLAKSLEEVDSTKSTQVTEAAETLNEQASEAMRKAAEELSRGRDGMAENFQDEILRQLEKARQSLNGSSQRNENDPASEPTGPQTFAVGVQQALKRQSMIVEQLQESGVSADPTNPTAEKPSLAAEQSEVAQLTQTIAEDQQAPPGFKEALDEAVAEMETAAALLERQTELEFATDSAFSARERLRFIADSLLSQEARAPENDEAVSEPQTPADAPMDDAQKGAQQGIPTETLKLLRATQQFLLQRTEQVMTRENESDPLNGDPVRAARRESLKQELADEQRQLVERIENYVREMKVDDESLRR